MIEAIEKLAIPKTWNLCICSCVCLRNRNSTPFVEHCQNNCKVVITNSPSPNQHTIVHSGHEISHCIKQHLTEHDCNTAKFVISGKMLKCSPIFCRCTFIPTLNCDCLVSFHFIPPSCTAVSCDSSQYCQDSPLISANRSFPVNWLTELQTIIVSLPMKFGQGMGLSWTLSVNKLFLSNWGGGHGGLCCEVTQSSLLKGGHKLHLIVSWSKMW